MRFVLDSDRSRLHVHASSSVHPIHAEARTSGWIELALRDDGSLDTAAAVAGRLELDLTGMRSGNPLVDREAERRLDVRRFPTVRGELSSLTSGPEGTGRFTGHGELTFHGVTRRLDGWLQMQVDDTGELRLDGETDLDVTDFGVQPPSLLLVKVHRHIRVGLRATARATTDRP
ncbi:MAG: YceI family protein [Acidimicrobiales bacterium]|jgi:polyisoprenoid-binding protein YceI|nr:YceI family protein [Acidimicrobiales bacterium]